MNFLKAVSQMLPNRGNSSEIRSYSSNGIQGPRGNPTGMFAGQSVAPSLLGGSPMSFSGGMSGNPASTFKAGGIAATAPIRLQQSVGGVVNSLRPQNGQGSLGSTFKSAATAAGASRII
jgi:hypothetical protein